MSPPIMSGTEAVSSQLITQGSELRASGLGSCCPPLRNDDIDEGDNSCGVDMAAVLCSPREILRGDLVTPTSSADYQKEAQIEHVALPVKIYFRYCWAFTGPLCLDTTSPMLCRQLMGQAHIETCELHSYLDNQPLKSFWLRRDGSLVSVSSFAQDVAFRRLRHAAVLDQVVHGTQESYISMCLDRCKADAHLARLCAQAVQQAEDMGYSFYNLYANHPLRPPPEIRISQSYTSSLVLMSEMFIESTVIHSGEALLTELRPLYQSYFHYMQTRCDEYLSMKIRLLDAKRLVNSDSLELRYALSLRHRLLTRVLTTMAILAGS